jgi:excisionase family DNA binding protein
MEHLLTIKEIAEKLNVTPKTIYLWVHQGKIPFMKINTIYRFDLSDVLKKLKKGTNND